MHSIIRVFLFTAAFIGFSGCSIRDVYIHDAVSATVPMIPADSIRHSIFLIGDAGEPAADIPEATFQTLTRMASVLPAKNTIVFLGDNIYPRGLPEPESPDRTEMERRLNEQIAVGTTSGAMTIFIPGNHDWEYHGRNGVEAIRREEEFILSRNHANVMLLPRNGTPGPHVVDLGTELRIIVLDTQWWLHAFEKPLYPGDSSEAQTRRGWIDSLSSVLSASDGRRVIVAAHHPVTTHGEHGGFFGWEDHLFPLRKLNPWLWIPLPGIGSLYPLSRMLGISNQDLSGGQNRAMTNAIDSLLSLHPPVAYAAGHEHTLQVLYGRSDLFYLVSGNGIAKHSEALTYGDNTLMATRKKGFMRLDVTADGRVRLGVITTGNGTDGEEIFSKMLR
jgi:hypothetical protein